jgi:hypothetical protein
MSARHRANRILPCRWPSILRGIAPWLLAAAGALPAGDAGWTTIAPALSLGPPLPNMMACDGKRSAPITAPSPAGSQTTLGCDARQGIASDGERRSLGPVQAGESDQRHGGASLNAPS